MNSVGGQRREDSANQLAPNSAPGADQIADYKISNSDINQMFTLKNNLADSRPRQQQQSAALQAVVGKRFTLHPESTVEEFKSFRQSMLHPATVLAIDLNMNNRPSEMAQNPAQAAAMANAFSALCDELLTHVAEIHTSVSELGVWKNEFINQPLPSSVKLNFTAMYSKLFRCQTSLHEPVFELVRQIKTYAPTWQQKSDALKELEDDYKRHRKALAVAIQKLELMKSAAEKSRREQVIMRWKRLVQQAIIRKDHFSFSKKNVDDEDGVDRQLSAARERKVKNDESLLLPAEEPGEAKEKSKKPDNIPANYRNLAKVKRALDFALTGIFRHYFPGGVPIQRGHSTMNYLSEVAETVISASEYELPPEEEPELVETVAEEDLDVDFQDLSPLIRSNSQIYISQRKMASKRLRFRSNSCSIAEKFQRDGFALTREVLDDCLPEWFADRRFEEESAMAEDESEETNDDDKSDADIDSENSTDKTAADEQKKQDNGDEEDEKDDDSRDNDETEDDPLDENNMKTTEDDYERSFFATQNLYEATKEFLEQEKQRVKFEDIWTAQSDAILANVNIEDTWFSLKDVMELTLLHTQQLHMIETRNAQRNFECGFYVNKVSMMMHEASYVDPWQFPDHFIGLDIEAEHAFRKKPPTPLKPSTPQQKQTEQAISAAEQAQAGAAADTLQNSLTAISGQPIPQSSLSNQFAKSSAASTTISSKATASALAEALYNQRRNQAFASRQQQTDNQRSHREQMALTMKLTREFFERMSKFIQKKTAKQEELKKAMVEHEREKTEKHLASMFASNVEGESSSGAPKNENDSVAPPQEQLKIMFNPIKPVQPGRTIPSFPQRNAKIDQQPNHHEAYNLATRPITGNFLTVRKTGVVNLYDIHKKRKKRSTK